MWLYDISIQSEEFVPTIYDSILSCAKDINVNRGTIGKYINTGAVYKYKYVFSSYPILSEELVKISIPFKTWEVITGELLGDGHISYNLIKRPNINGRLEFTFSSKILSYVNYLKFDALSNICTNSSPTPWPNGQEVNQYWFSTKRMESISILHSKWYRREQDKYIKIIPYDIEEIITPLSIAHWIMGDGYFYNSVILCTDNFSKNEVNTLINVLNHKFSLKATIRKRSNNNVTMWRIYISKTSLERLKEMVIPFFIPEMLYKLGI